jgi:alpha-tubulin suppressor-like RCC1 family protein
MKQKLYYLIGFFLIQIAAFAQQGTHLNFDGVNDNVVLPVNIGNTLSNGTEITIEYWFKGTNIQSAVRIQNGGGWIVAGWGDPNNPLFLVSTDGGINGVSCGSIVNDNTWHHLAFVWKKNDTFATYLDGVLQNSRVAANVNLPIFSGTTAYIGSFYGSSEFMNGNIDDVRIWNVAKTPAQINAAKNCELQGNEAGLVAYYKFNQGIDAANNTAVTTLTDATTNGNNGTLTNFTLNGATSNWLAGSPIGIGSPTVTTPVVYTQGDTASALTATVGANGTGLLWYTTAIGGTGSTTAPTPSTAAVGNTSYWVSSTNANGCESDRVEIVVTVNAIPPATHLNFDGVNDYVSIGNILPSSYTKEAWIFVNGTGSLNIISGSMASGQNAFWVPNGYLSAGHNGGWYAVTDTSVLALNTWYHVAVSYDSLTQTLKLYKNGILISTANGVPAPINGNEINIGAFNQAAFFNGNIEEVRVWNTVRTDSEIAASRNCELQGNEAGLVAYYKFNQGLDAANNTTITTLIDATANANNGTLTNFTLNGATSNFLAGSPVTSIGNPTTAPVLYTQGNTATPLTAVPGIYATGLLWYTTATGGVGSTTAPIPSTVNPGNTSYWVSCINANGCESDRVEIIVTVNASVGVGAAGCWAQISSGFGNHTLAIKLDGTLWAWGSNTYGQLGNGTNTDNTVPTQIGTDTNWSMISAGENHSLALKSDGTMWAWGHNAYGQVGDNTTIDKNVPTQIGTGGAFIWTMVAAGGNHSIGLNSNNKPYLWGYNAYGQLGFGGTANELAPRISSVRNRIYYIAAGKNHSIFSGGLPATFLLCAGLNTNGQFGNNTTANSTTFQGVSYPAIFTSISVGANHTLAIDGNGTLWAFGANSNGQLGDNTTVDKLVATQISTNTNWASVDAGTNHSLARKSDGTLWSWGYNNVGQLGDGTNIDKAIPSQMGTETNWTIVSAGNNNSFGIKSNNNLMGWGDNSNGKLGDGTTVNKNTPSIIECGSICSETTTWNGTVWSNGLPDLTKQVIFTDNYTGDAFNACTLQVTGTSIVVINSGGTVHVNGAVTVDATAVFEFQNNANLIQLKDDANTGNVKMHRNSTPMIRLDYTAWSSPVASQNLLSFSPSTLANRFYTYEPSGTTTPSAWIPVASPSTTNFTVGKGYLIRVANNWSATVASPYSGIFEGVPNNGDISIPTTIGFNLVGNPYPSSILADQFIDDNIARGVSALYYWTHKVAATGTTYPVNNYASYTKAGGVAAAAGGFVPNDVIPMGQGYITNVTSAGNVLFNNNIRRSQNSQFFRSANTVERHRFWLNISDNTNDYNQLMVAYMTGATNGFDQGIDAALLTNSNTNIASLINDEKYVIQGRALAFNDNDEVALSFATDISGNFKISLNNFDGLFADQDIYLWDKMANIKHDIKQSEYNFNSNAGTFNERFSIVYKNGLLNNEDFEGSNNLIVFINSSNQIIIEDSKNYLETVEIYDVSGRQLFSKNGISSNEFNVLNSFGNQVLLVRVTNENGIVLTKKVLK